MQDTKIKTFYVQRPSSTNLLPAFVLGLFFILILFAMLNEKQIDAKRGIFSVTDSRVIIKYLFIGFFLVMFLYHGGMFIFRFVNDWKYSNKADSEGLTYTNNLGNIHKYYWTEISFFGMNLSNNREDDKSRIKRTNNYPYIKLKNGEIVRLYNLSYEMVLELASNKEFVKMLENNSVDTNLDEWKLLERQNSLALLLGFVIISVLILPKFIFSLTFAVLSSAYNQENVYQSLFFLLLFVLFSVPLVAWFFVMFRKLWILYLN